MGNTGSFVSIDEQAARWAADIWCGDMALHDRARLSAWLEADVRHRGAYIRARAALHVMEGAVMDTARAESADTMASAVPVSTADYPSGDDDVMARPWWKPSLRWGGKAMAGGIALAASVAMVAVMGPPLLTSINRSQVASDQQIVTLKDGSVVTLTKDARIEVVLLGDVRKITLLQGEAFFRVAKDTSRPFVVRSGDVFAQATGTAYSVKRVGAFGAAVKVMHGSVLVWPRDARDQAVQLYAGDGVTLDLQPQVLKAASHAIPAPPPELAQISLDNVSVRSAVARFNRVNSTQIIIADPKIGDIRIVGLFEANDVEKFAEAVSALSGGDIQHKDNKIVIKMK